MKYSRLKAACYMTNISMSVVGNLSPLLFVTFRETYGISYTLLGLLVLINFSTQLIVDLVFSFFCLKALNSPDFPSKLNLYLSSLAGQPPTRPSIIWHLPHTQPFLLLLPGNPWGSATLSSSLVSPSPRCAMLVHASVSLVMLFLFTWKALHPNSLPTAPSVSAFSCSCDKLPQTQWLKHDTNLLPCVLANWKSEVSLME